MLLQKKIEPVYKQMDEIDRVLVVISCIILICCICYSYILHKQSDNSNNKKK